MPDFADHFSRTASAYAAFRPRYPAALFTWLAGRVRGRQRVWDCGTGNGQAAVALAERFDEVIASDPSVAQLTYAERADGVSYVAMTAERSALADHSVDAVTVAQALHWFDLDAFYREVVRVLRPGGVLAVWSYGLLLIDPTLDDVIARFHHETVGPYWPSERAIVDSGYAGIHFPFAEERAPMLQMRVEWTLPQLAGYVSTWSAVNRYRADRGEDPVPLLERQLAPLWGEPDKTRAVRWPLLVRMGRVVG